MNIADRLTQWALEQPDKKAVVFPKRISKDHKYQYTSYTFKELDVLSNKFSVSLKKLGLKKGDKTLLFIKPSLDFSAIAFALFKAGIVPVFIDPGMGKKNLLKCIKEVEPVGMIAEKELHYLKYLYPTTFRSIKFNVTTGKLTWGKMSSILKMKKEKILVSKNEQNLPHETAAILYTSGGTGIPKGVVYTHQIFNTQTQMLKEMFDLKSDDIDLPGFPLFSLFTIAMGMTSCIPDMDPTKPGLCEPAKIVKNILDQKPTFVAGSPAIWERVADYCLKNSILLPSVKYVVMFGAPVSTKIHRKFKSLLPNGTTYTPYGATEALPVCNISGEYILKNTVHKTEEGHGTCIGLPTPGIEVEIIKITDDIISQFNRELIIPNYQVGEIIVKGLIVTPEYLNLPTKTAEAKIYENTEVLWHRMGDLGYKDELGRIWFCGRKSHMVVAKNNFYYPIPCEAIFNNHPAVKRSALVGIGEQNDQTPAIVIERKDGHYLSGKARSIFESELMALAKKHKHTQEIQKIYLSKHFPVDVRHNIKIDRLKLKEEIEKHELN